MGEVVQAIERARFVWDEVGALLDQSRDQELVQALQRMTRELPTVGPTLDLESMDGWTLPIDQGVHAMSLLGHNQLAHDLAWTLVDVFIVQRGGASNQESEPE